jgi:hypothetical protein
VAARRWPASAVSSTRTGYGTSYTVGCRYTHVTETVYHHVIVPAIRGGATIVDDVFGDEDGGEPRGRR